MGGEIFITPEEAASRAVDEDERRAGTL